MGLGLVLGVGLAFGFGCRITTSRQGEVGRQLRELTGAHTRVVWAQDTGAGTDLYAQGNTFRLMGLDSDDGRGARVIVPGISNYSRPMLTPRGDQIVFSRREDNRIYIVQWDGSGLRPLTEGYAVDTWLDPEDQSEWVVFFSGARSVNNMGEPAYEAARRCRLDDPSRVEHVWSGHPIAQLGENNFQLSADGRYASIHNREAAGVIDIAGQTWARSGIGCWPSMAPDASHRCWYFEGGHRRIHLFDDGETQGRSIAINDAPGVDGAEVFHPRWSNHPRFLTMTGPLKVAGGGPGVEVYVGRFDADFTTVEQWVQITRNEKADIFPDVWVATGLDSALRTIRTGVPPNQPAVDASPLAARPGCPVFLWGRRDAQNEIRGESGALVCTCHVEPRGEARFGRFFEMRVVRGSFVAETGAEELAGAIRSGGAFSFELTVTSDVVATGAPATVMVFTGDEGVENFRLFEENGQYGFNVLTAEGAAGPFRFGTVEPGRPRHLALSYRPGELVAWLDGEPVLNERTAEGAPDTWSPGTLSFGGAGWTGQLEGVAIWNRVLGEAEVRKSYERRAAAWKGRKALERLTLVGRLVEVSVTPEPQAISPYRRALLVHRYIVLSVEEGSFENGELLAAHWVIMDGAVLEDARRSFGKIYRLQLEPFERHPELEGERLIQDVEVYHLPLYYDSGE